MIGVPPPPGIPRVNVSPYPDHAHQEIIHWIMCRSVRNAVLTDDIELLAMLVTLNESQLSVMVSELNKLGAKDWVNSK